ncbi:MAG: primosomal protein N' [Planctomycetes bacterium]|nr:primosomal protein N' [Planctomycetota bacterium]
MKNLQPELFEGAAPAESSEPTTTAELFAEIVFDRPVEQIYSYGVPAHLLNDVGVGKRVVAPFGRGNRAETGYCVGLHTETPVRQVKDILRVLDDEPLLSPHMLRLTRWMADYYLCGWGQVLNSVLPAGARRQAGTRSATFLEAVPGELCPSPLPSLSAKQKAALEILRAQARPIAPRRLASLARCGSGPIAGLLDKNLARRVVRRIDRLSAGEIQDSTEQVAIDVPPSPLTLNVDQARAWASLESAVQNGGFRSFLLYGVTGSGKTELYLRAIDEVVRQGKEALVLVPEISLTPQTIARFRGRFRSVSVLHSHLQMGERGGHWRRVASGQAQVVVGARSAVFAPARRLGLIVIDEEHEATFKQETTPRYHARDVAVMRARIEDIPIILGSATPSLESWHNAQRGQYTLLTLPSRVLDRPLPHVALIDLRHDRHPGGRLHAVSPSLERAMNFALGKGGQVMLLLNRRGFSTHVFCPSCGYVEQCKFCDLSLTFHRDRDVVMCHYCGYEQPPPERCPTCSLSQVRYQGLGTEKLQTEVEAKFPQHVVRRMDSDTMRQPGSHQRLLDAFRQGEVHILLGTQMIAKGLDFPNVTLVGVVNADVGLHRADFRAPERTFQLLAQVAGRTGRGPQGGRVLIQTYTPEHYSIAAAVSHDYERFAGMEMDHRRAHAYPPFQRMARLIIRGKDKDKADEFAERLAGAFRVALERLPENNEGVRLLGPAEASIFRLKGYYRFHFQVQSPSPALLHQVLRNVIPTVKPPRGVELSVDVDPHDMT